MRSLDHAVRYGLPSQLSIEGSGTVSVYPRQSCYVTDIQDWESVYAVGREQIHVHPTAWATPPTAALPLEELRWRAAFHDHYPASAAEAPPVLGHELVVLASWPNLTRLPDELLGPVTRVCALLWRKPTVGYLIPRVLQLPPHQVFALLQVLQAFGHVSAPGLGVKHASDCADAPEATAATLPKAQAVHGLDPLPAAADSLIAKLWQRLTRPQTA